MGSPTEIYVDPSLASGSGTGTIGDPYGDLQYALDNATRDTTNGNRFNIKAGTDEILAAALDFTTFGGGTGDNFDQPIIFQGYTSAAGDGGIGGINGNATYGILGSAVEGCAFIDMHCHNSGSAVILAMGEDAYLRNVEIDNTSTNAVTVGGSRGLMAIGCNLHNIGGVGFQGLVFIKYCYFANGTNDFTTAIQLDTNGACACHNIMSLDGASKGIVCSAFHNIIGHNSILCSAGTGVGIQLSGVPIGALVLSNLVEGFSGAGGVNFDLNSTTRYQRAARNNGSYNGTTGYDIQGEFMDDENDNESLGASPFDKSGADTFANRFTYFAPVDTGNVRGGAFPSGSRRDKGAVQHADPAGGSGGLITHPGMTGGISA